MMNTGISRMSSPEGAREVMEAAARFGFDGVQMKPNQYRPTGMTASGFEAAFPGLTHLAAGGLIAYPPPDLDAWEEHLAPVFPFAAAIGASHVCLCSGVKRRDDSDARFREAADVLTAAGHAARDAGVRISLHNHAHCMWESENDLARQTDLLDPEIVGLTIDTGHCAKGGITDIPALIRRFQPFLLNVHLKDMTADGAFCPLGTGTVDLASVIETLLDLGYDRWLIVDEESEGVPVEDAFAQTVDYLRAHGIMK